jgi:hypothetical membrane protein
MSATTRDRPRPRLSAFPAVLSRSVALGGACWSLLVLFFVGQAIAQAAVAAPYSLLDNNISDLGVTTCGPIVVGNYHAEVCSPWHGVMNATFVVAGLHTAIGAISTWPAWPAVRRSAWGLGLLVLSGAGEVVAGLAPADVNPVLHVAASIPGILGLSVAVLLLGTVLWAVRRGLGGAALLAAAVGLFGFFFAPTVGLPTGLSERLAGYPGVLWLIATGVFLLWSATGRAGRPGTQEAERERAPVPHRAELTSPDGAS